jgi:hypothetical protein
MRKRRGIGGLLAVAFIVLGVWQGRHAGVPGTPASPSGITLSERRLQHILYGDGSGGGHLYGQGHACKSEFPASWDKDKIAGTVERIAANDNLGWKTQSNGYSIAEQTVEGVRVRVVLNGRDVITAYPVNVRRNRCAANDD